jgi:hypothetical protein
MRPGGRGDAPGSRLSMPAPSAHPAYHTRRLALRAAAVAILDQSVNRAGEQVDAGQQADRAEALIFMIAREGRVLAGLGR